MPAPPRATPTTEYYKRVAGWFNFQDVYDLAVSQAARGDRLVEVGCWLGRSTCYLAERARAADKDLKLFAVDTFSGSPEHAQLGEEFLASLYERFLCHLSAGGYLDAVRTIALESVRAARLFPDGSLFFCFIDACHEYESVRADIDAWLPKVRPGGILAGHDYSPKSPGVVRAVNELFPGQFTVSRHSWLVRKQGACLGTTSIVVSPGGRIR